MTAVVGEGIVELVGVFRHGVAAVVAGVLQVIVAADEGSAAEIDGAVGVDDAEARRDRFAREDGIVRKGVAVVACAKFVEQTAGKGVRFAQGVATAVHQVLARGKAGGQVGQARGPIEVGVVVGEAGEDAVCRAWGVVEASVEGVEVPDVYTLGAVIVERAIVGARDVWQVIGVEVLDRGGVEAAGGNDVGDAV